MKKQYQIFLLAASLLIATAACKGNQSNSQADSSSTKPAGDSINSDNAMPSDTLRSDSIPARDTTAGKH